MDKRMKTAARQSLRLPNYVHCSKPDNSEFKSADNKSQGQIQLATESGWIKLGDAAEILVARIGGAT